MPTAVIVKWCGYQKRIQVKANELNGRAIKKVMAEVLGIQKFVAPFTWKKETK